MLASAALAATDGAIDLRSRERISFGAGANANRTGFDSYGKYGVCDFDGDVYTNARPDAPVHNLYAY